jgi:hypothetical protein
MQKRPSSRTGGSARVDAILRYRSASEGVLCSARCRELSRTGLTATIERAVFPGDLLRFDLEPVGGGRSVLGLARVAWTGSDPEGPPGTSIMRMRFLSLGDVSEHALLEWLEELSSASERPSSSPQDDSSVRALGRAIADSLLPPPPVLPGAPPSTESSSGLTPAPIAVPNRPSIPPPPGLYVRGARDLTHPVESVGRVATSIAPPLPPPSNPPPPPSKRRPSVPAPATARPSMFPHLPSLFDLDAPTVPNMAAVLPPPVNIQGVPAGAASRPIAKSQALRDSPSARRTAEVRERLARFKNTRRDQTPLRVPVEDKSLALHDDAPPSLMSAPPFARVSAQPPLPLGALLNAPPETTRRSTPAPAPSELPPALGDEVSSASWPALRVPPAIAALAHEEPLEREPRETMPPPASIPDMPPLRVSSPAPALDEADAERVSPPRASRQPPLSDAPWSVPARPPFRATSARPWLALALGSLACGAGAAYLIYGTSLLRGPGDPPVAAGPDSALEASGPSPASASEDVLAPMMMVPTTRTSVPELNAPDVPADPFRPVAKPVAKPVVPAPAPAVTALAAATAPLGAGRLAPLGPAAAQPAASKPPAPVHGGDLQPLPVAPAKEIEPGDKLPPPAPLLPAALGGIVDLGGSAPAPEAAPASSLERARACLARGDIPCATELLRNAATEPELELWIETLRAKGDGLEARRAMKRFLETYPNGRRASIYRRILSNANTP